MGKELGTNNLSYTKAFFPCFQSARTAVSRLQRVNGAIFHLPIMEGNIRSALKMITFDRGAQLQKTTQANGEIAKVNPRGRRISFP